MSIQLIREALDNIISQNTDRQIPITFMGTVQSIDDDVNGRKTLCTVQPLDTELNAISNIALTASQTQVPAHIPTVGTTVMVTLSDNSSGYVSQIGDTSQINLNPGTVSFGGLVKIDPLTQLLQAIETYINNHIQQAFNTHTHSYLNGSTPATTGIPVILDNSTPPNIDANALQNTSVTHSNGVQLNAAYQAKLAEAQAAVQSASVALNLADIALKDANNSPSAIQADITIAQNNYNEAKKIYDNAVFQYNYLKQNPE